MANPAELTPASRIVVVGGGFGGLEVVKALGRNGIGATVIDRHNHYLFQPLLYQVATAALSAPDIAEPIRRILSAHSSIQVLFGEVVRIDMDRRLLILADGSLLAFDALVLATGSQPHYFGNSDWQSIAPGLKTIEDARRIRSQLLLSFERAERTVDAAEQRRLTTFAVIGGGPTGVELAGSIAELSRYTLVRDFRNIRPETTRVLLIEAGERLLAGFAPKLSAYALSGLRGLGVEVRLGQRVERIAPDEIMLNGEAVPVGLTLWAAGVAASPLASHLGVALDGGGRVAVDAELRVCGLTGVFAIGDVAATCGEGGALLPGLAQVAKQQGVHLGEGIARIVRQRGELTPFAYRSRGNTAIVGRHAAVFEHGRVKLTGWWAWLAWAVIHVYLLVGFQHRVQVSIQWLWRYLTYERGARLIAEHTREAAPLPEGPAGAKSLANPPKAQRGPGEGREPRGA